jgi:3-hydroxypropanoate dehydrogenase
MRRIANDEALDTLFRLARNHHAWLARPVSDTLLRALGELVKRGPTGLDQGRALLLFMKSQAAKERLAPAAAQGERGALLAAPVVAAILCPSDGALLPAASREAGLAAASLILAARALGLDCGPLWELDSRLVDRAFLPQGGAAAAVLCAIGYGDDAAPPAHQALPRRDEACTIL